jgi:hypothetical protein
MLEIRKPTHKPIVVIRAATGHELSMYEKRKLASIEDNAQENKIEAVSVNVNGEKQRLPINSKEVCIDLGELAFKNTITPNELSAEDLFFIECSLNDAD